MTFSYETPVFCHPREGGDPEYGLFSGTWIPAFAGMTTKN